MGSKLNWVGIENDYCNGVETLRVIGARFGVSASMISRTIKKNHWTRNLGSQPSSQNSSQDESPLTYADFEHAERGVRILGRCLVKLETIDTKNVRELKTIIESVAMCVGAIRRINGTDTPHIPDIAELDAQIEYGLEELARRREASALAKADSQEPAESDAPEGTADRGIQRQG
jgi:hypothetical protein